MLDAAITTGVVRAVLLTVGVVALVVLVLGRGRRCRWWTRSVPLAWLAATAAALVVVVVVDVLWRPFPDPVPRVTAVWIGLTVGAGVLAFRHHLRPVPRIGALVLVLVVALSGAAQINQHFQAYPTLRAALGLRPPNLVDLAQVPPATATTVSARSGSTLDAAWAPPADMPTAGVLATTPIAGGSSGFAARTAWIYLPPAYLTSARPLLPVLVLVPGQPGGPRDWIDGGNAFSYLSVDVPAWIRSNLQVDPDRRSWAVGGMSAGGTCSLQLAVNAPTVFPSFIDISGQAEPTIGSRRRTVDSVFGGDAAAFAAVNPLDVLASRTFPDTAGFLVAGRDDTTYRPEAQLVFAATRAAGMSITYLELPGPHSWQVWGPGLQRSLPWLATRTGLTP